MPKRHGLWPFLESYVNYVNFINFIILSCQHFSVNLVCVSRNREKKTELVGVKLGPKTKKALERVAEWHDWSVSQTARFAIETYLREHYPDLISQDKKEKEPTGMIVSE